MARFGPTIWVRPLRLRGGVSGLGTSSLDRSDGVGVSVDDVVGVGVHSLALVQVLVSVVEFYLDQKDPLTRLSRSPRICVDDCFEETNLSARSTASSATAQSMLEMESYTSKVTL